MSMSVCVCVCAPPRICSRIWEIRRIVIARLPLMGKFNHSPPVNKRLRCVAQLESRVCFFREIFFEYGSAGGKGEGDIESLRSSHASYEFRRFEG